MGKKATSVDVSSKEYMCSFSQFYIKSHSYYGFAGELEESESLESLRKYGLKRNDSRSMRVWQK